MGANATETVREIEETRSRLDSELRELEGRLPAPATWAKRLVGVAVGGGAGGAVFWYGVRRLRGRSKKRKAKLPQANMQAVVHVLPERWADSVGRAMEDGRVKSWAAVAGGVWVLLRLAELRQLRRMNRALMPRIAGGPQGI